MPSSLAFGVQNLAQKNRGSPRHGLQMSGLAISKKKTARRLFLRAVSS